MRTQSASLKIDDIRISNEMLMLIAEVDELKGAWRALGALSPERLSALRRRATIESIGASSRLDGGRLSDHETERLLLDLETRPISRADERKAVAYAEVLGKVFHSWNDIPVNEKHIRQIHRDLTQYSDRANCHRGEYRTEPKSEHGSKTTEDLSVVLKTEPHNDVPRLMTELIAWLHEEQKRKRLHPLIVIAIFVFAFLEIRPFEQGNGRLSRVLTTLLLLKAGYGYTPYSSLDHAIENDMQACHRAIWETQNTIRTAHANWRPWLLFFLKALNRQALRIASEVDHERFVVAARPEPVIRIIEFVRQHGRVSLSQMAEASGLSKNTLKDHFRRMVEKQHLVRYGTGKGCYYAFPTATRR